MIVKVRNGHIYDEDGIIIGQLTREGSTPEVERVIQLGSEAIPVIEDFVDQVNSGKFKPRTVVKKFEQIIDKYKI